jgi:hypothetical protein
LIISPFDERRHDELSPVSSSRACQVSRQKAAVHLEDHVGGVTVIGLLNNTTETVLSF